MAENSQRTRKKAEKVTYSARTNITFTPDQKAIVDAATSISGSNQMEFMRTAILAHAQKVITDATRLNGEKQIDPEDVALKVSLLASHRADMSVSLDILAQQVQHSTNATTAAIQALITLITGMDAQTVVDMNQEIKNY